MLKSTFRSSNGMVDPAENDQDDRTDLNLRIQTEDLAFKPDELIACDGCGRMNPPTRLKCIYCARELKIDEKNASLIKPDLRRLEGWERGTNLIVDHIEPDIDLAAIAGYLSMETADVTSITSDGKPLPIARLESGPEAAVVQHRLGEMGLHCTTVGDDDLAPDRLPVRLGGIDLAESEIAFRAFNTGEITRTESSELKLIVTGVLTASKVDSMEKKAAAAKPNFWMKPPRPPMKLFWIYTLAAIRSVSGCFWLGLIFPASAIKRG